MAYDELDSIARQLVADSKGILAADESTGTITKRFGRVQVESTPDTRRAYREMLFTTPAIEESISGIILYDETIRQTAANGTPFPKLLQDKGIIPGIKVDAGTAELPGFPGEKVTQGLDGLPKRLQEYRALGARFAKWRAVIAIGPDRPSRRCLDANAEALALYAGYCQEAGLVPIVEPEVLMDGDHSLARCAGVTETTLRTVFARLGEQHVRLEAVLLKPNMVIPGHDSQERPTVDMVAAATIRCLRRSVPPAVPGIVFLSGGQSPEQASAHLNAMQAHGPQPWALGFSFARALQDPALALWKGADRQVPAAQRVFSHRAHCNVLARQGRYTAETERLAA